MIADFHNDCLTDKANCSALRYRNTVYALFRGTRSRVELLRILKRFRKKRVNDGFLGLEDVGYLTEENADEFLSVKTVYASLTWNYENELAGGCLQDHGLKPRGRKMIRLLNAKKIALDCAHLGEKAFFSAIDISERVVASHTCAKAVHEHPRNLNDRQIAEIVERNGLIGITFVGGFLSAEPCVNDLFIHMDYCVQRFGFKYFCFGTDYFGSDDIPKGLDSYEEAEKNLRPLFERAGYSEEAINAIFYENLCKFLYNRSEANFAKP